MKPCIGDRDVLEKRIARSDKFKGARSTVDTGNNVLNTKPPEKMERKGENFKRLRSDRLAQLIEDEPEKVVVLDVRECEEFEAGHIGHALHYPPIKLCHATNPFLPEMLMAKNREGHRVVVYDLDDGAAAARSASLVFEKGFDNVFCLTGGLQDFVREYAGLVDGTPPAPGPTPDLRPVRVVSDADSAAGSARSSRPSRGGAASRLSTTSNASALHKPKPLSSSQAKASPGGWR